MSVNELHQIAKRDGWWCFYCDTPLVPPRERRKLCEYVPAMVYAECHCGLHEPGEPCVREGFYALPQGYDWPTCDHVIPSSKGGSNAIENLVLACRSCNSRKQDREAELYL